MTEPKPDDAEVLPGPRQTLPEPAVVVQSPVLGALVIIEHALLILVAVMTIAVAGFDVIAIIERQRVDLADILLMFLYTEVIGMVAVFYSGKGSPFIYPIFIAITALARLMVIQGKDLDPLTIVYQAVAVLLLALAAVIIARFAKA